MKGNRISRNKGSVLAMAGRVAGGMQGLETALGITGTSAAVLRGLRDASQVAASAANAAKANYYHAGRALQAADATARSFLMQAKKVLTCFIGNRWGARWEATGFPDQSTEIPRRRAQRWNLCAQLQSYFAANPAHENPLLGVTAAKAGENFAAMRSAQSALLHAQSAVDEKLQARDAAFEKLRREIHYTLIALTSKLSDNDPHWYQFGLNAPADPHVPERVESVELKPMGPGLLSAVWPRAARATRYRPFVQVVGKDTEPRARPPNYDPRALLSGFATGERVRIFILAANATGEAAPSPTAEITIT